MKQVTVQNTAHETGLKKADGTVIIIMDSTRGHMESTTTTIRLNNKSGYDLSMVLAESQFERPPSYWTTALLKTV